MPVPVAPLLGLTLSAAPQTDSGVESPAQFGRRLHQDDRGEVLVDHATSMSDGSVRGRPRALGDRGRPRRGFHSIRALVAIPAVTPEPWDGLPPSSRKSTGCTAGRLSFDGPGHAWHGSTAAHRAQSTRAIDETMRTI